MSKEVIARASEIINAKAGYVGGGMEGYAAVSLIDENGYPSTATITIATADGINQLTFCTSPDRNFVTRAVKCNRASVCINSSEYNLTLVGTMDIVTDPEIKKANWMPIMDNNDHWTGPDDPNFAVLRFTTERYSLYVVDTGEAEGKLKDAAKIAAPKIEPMLQFNRQCTEAIELYKKAFGAEVVYLGSYASANPKDLPPKYNPQTDANLVYHAQLMIGSQRIMLCDNLFNDTQPGHTVYPVMQFKTAAEVKSAFEIMKDGATIVNSPYSTTYCECCCTLVDKFGVFWDLMVY